MKHESTCPSRATEVDPRRGFFDHHAHHWDDDAKANGAMLARLDDLAVTIGLRPGLDVLEVGCGTGLVTAWLASRVKPGRLTAADFSSAMLARAASKNLPAELVCLDICAEPPPERAYDLALCFQCFPHFRDPSAALTNLAMGLRKGGRLVILHLCGREQINHFHRGVGGAVAHDALPADEAWASLLGCAGLVQRTLLDRPDLFLVEAIRES